MPETAENVAEIYSVSRADQDRFALRSQHRWKRAQERGYFSKELIPVTVHAHKGESRILRQDEQPRPDTTVEALARLKPVVKHDGTVTAGNASPLNDGAGAMLLSSEQGIGRHALTPRARVVASAAAGIAPRIMGFAPAYAMRKVLALAGLGMGKIDVVELNEAFAAQALAVTRDLGLSDDDARVNPNGGAIAIGHPLGASGVRLVMTALNQLEATQGRYALCSMCIGVGQALAIIIERV